MSGELINPNLDIRTFVNFTHDDLHDTETGRSVRFHTKLQRSNFLLRHPELVGKLPPVEDPKSRSNWSGTTSFVNGTPVLDPSDAAQRTRYAALLSDPMAQCGSQSRRGQRSRSSPRFPGNDWRFTKQATPSLRMLGVVVRSFASPSSSATRRPAMYEITTRARQTKTTW
jgi:hypothetical protein